MFNAKVAIAVSFLLFLRLLTMMQENETFYFGIGIIIPILASEKSRGGRLKTALAGPEQATGRSKRSLIILPNTGCTRYSISVE